MMWVHSQMWGRDEVGLMPRDHEVQPELLGTPPAPVVKPGEIWPGTPNLLMDAERYSIGWQGWPVSKGGASFVTVRRTSIGGLKVVERFALTAGFAERKQLDARSLTHLPDVIFVGGYLDDDELTAGQHYELRFLEDELAIYQRGSLIAVAVVPYAAVQEVEVAGPGLVRKWSPAQQALLAAAFGVTGALISYANTRIKTLVRIQAAGSELFFLHTELLPEDLRVVLSRGIGAVREAQQPAVGAAAGAAPSLRSPADELTRLPC
jgi:hypothetical protein